MIQKKLSEFQERLKKSLPDLGAKYKKETTQRSGAANRP